MATPTHYVPRISRFLVCALYHEGQRRGAPMTRLVDELLTDALKGTPGWLQAEEQSQSHAEMKAAPTRRDQPRG